MLKEYDFQKYKTNKFFPRHFQKSKVADTPRPVLFAQLLPTTNKRSKTGLVQCVLGPMSTWEYNPGAKKIDVISRIVFLATFAGLNVIYWSYYLAKADNTGKDDSDK